MFRKPYLPSRSRSRTTRSWRRLILPLILTFYILEALHLAFHDPPARRVHPSTPPAENSLPRIFIASIHRNNEWILRGYWNEALLGLVRHFGPQNVYVSLYESGSLDETKEALRELDATLEPYHVPRSIVLDGRDQIEEVSRSPNATEPGWIWTKNGRNELRRIPYLANLRNEVMESLYAQQEKGEVYDLVLWLNDVVFTTEDIVTLIATNGGSYDAACAMDFSVPRIYYDTFALRDLSGSKAEPQMWPYFLDPRSRRAVMASLPAPVSSCWNGAVAMKADAFYASPRLKFRGVEDGLAKHHLEGSECCLIHADNANRREESEGVWLNPNVRVGYTPDAYFAVNPLGGVWPGRLERVQGMWENRLSRWLAWPRRWMEGRTVARRLKRWAKQGKEEEADGGRERLEAGDYCLINEMQVLVEAGWKHV